jgi:hypothetical protein
VIAAIIDCGSPANGSLLYGCESCPQQQLLPRCCGNRHCPACQQYKAYAWLDAQLKGRLPTHHFMLTFTVPEQLRTFIGSHPRIGYAALFDASAGAIKTLADPKLLGADALSMPGAPRLLLTCFKARVRFARSDTRSISVALLVDSGAGRSPAAGSSRVPSTAGTDRLADALPPLFTSDLRLPSFGPSTGASRPTTPSADFSTVL